MFKKIKCGYTKKELKEMRSKMKKDGYISSVMIASMIRKGELDKPKDQAKLFRNLSFIARNDDSFNAIMVNVYGTTKWYYKKDEINEIYKLAMGNQ